MKTSVVDRILVIFLSSILLVTILTPPIFALDGIPVKSDPAVISLSKERNISLEEAEERISWSESAAKLDQEILKNDIVGYGGIWINPENDRVQLGLSKNIEESSKTKIVEMVDDTQSLWRPFLLLLACKDSLGVKIS